LAKVQIGMAVDPFKVLTAAISKAGKRFHFPRVVSVDYDEEADVLYARFGHEKIADSKPLDRDGMIMGSLSSRGKLVGLMIMHASEFS
jgi:uncharacterized protein YuzE